MHVNAQLIAQQEGILRSIQEGNARGGRAPRGHPQPPVQPPPGAWQQWGREAWGTDRASTIPEEDEDYEEEGDWEDEGDDGWGQPYPHNQRVRFSSNVSYASQSPRSASRAPAHNAQAPQTPAQASVRSLPRSAAHSIPGGWKPSPISSRTMQMATGTIPMTTATVKTTVFELAPPRNGLGENAFVDSHGVALIPAERALYSRERPAKERFRWGFNPDKDPRVGSLLHWISAMSNGIANIGVSLDAHVYLLHFHLTRLLLATEIHRKRRARGIVFQCGLPCALHCGELITTCIRLDTPEPTPAHFGLHSSNLRHAVRSCVPSRRICFPAITVGEKHGYLEAETRRSHCNTRSPCERDFGCASGAQEKLSCVC